MPNLLVVIASTRPGRIGLPIGKWTAEIAAAHGGFDVKIADLAELDLPVFDEALPPRMGRYEHEHTRRWAALVDEADAFIFVSPEYNYMTPTALVNAMTYLLWEWAYKPVGFVTYGGISGGLRGLQHTRLLVSSLRGVPVNDGVVLPFVMPQVKDGVFTATEMNTEVLEFHLNEILRWSDALRPLAAQVPELRKILPPGAPKPPVGGPPVGGAPAGAPPVGAPPVAAPTPA